MNLTKDMLQIVVIAMMNGINRKGKRNGMVSLVAIEKEMYEMNIQIFVPLSHVISALITEKRVAYFKLDSGKLVYGFTKSMQDEMFGAIAQQAPTREYAPLPPVDTNHWGAPIDISDDDLPF